MLGLVSLTAPNYLSKHSFFGQNSLVISEVKTGN